MNFSFYRPYIIYKLVFAGLFALPFFFVVTAFKNAGKATELHRFGQTTKGVVVSVDKRVEKDDDEDVYYYRAYLQYEDSAGKEYRSYLDESTEKYSENDTIELVYLADNPKKVWHNEKRIIQKAFDVVGNAGLVILFTVLLFMFYMFFRKEFT